MKNVFVEFNDNSKKYVFDSNNVDVNISDFVIVETEKGTQLAKVVGFIEEDNSEREKILSKATDEEINKHNTNINLAKEALCKAQEISNNLNLNINFVDGYYTLDQKQLVLNFFSENRIDFRELAKSLAAIYKTRIELRQIGIRDKAKNVSGIGMCGRKLCCSCFLKDLDAVSISMVKNQNLSLNPNKINGLCGRLLCCLKYENQDYIDSKKKLPCIGDKMKYKEINGTVKSIDALSCSYIFEDENGCLTKISCDRCNDCERKKCNK